MSDAQANSWTLAQCGASPLLLVKSVGLMSDGRICDDVVGLRAVTSVDEMTVDSCPFDMASVGPAATRLVNEVKGINRVMI